LFGDLASDFLFILLQFFLVLLDHVLHIAKIALEDTVFLVEDTFLKFLFLFYLFLQLFNPHDQSFVGASQSGHYFLELADFEVTHFVLIGFVIIQDVVYLIESLALEGIIVL
jgi:hypothetical protein